jgi:GTP-binding protein HflX
VGFISDLPTELVAAFRATLEEVLEAHVICHVRDISHPATDEQAEDVETILDTLGVAEDRPLIEVWNKIDLMDDDTRAALETRADRNEDVVAVSAVTGAGMDTLLARITHHLSDLQSEEEIVLAFDEGRKRAWLFAQDVVVEETQTDDGFALRVRWSDKQKAKFTRL